MQIQVLNARTSREIDAAFASIVRERPDALIVSTGTFFTDRRIQLTQLATRHAVPTIYGWREHAEVGGLMTYGPNVKATLRRAASYVDRILKGAKPADLPVEQPTKFELVINLKTAKELGLKVPPALLISADEMIE
jgi:putative ABC transport system substrate-binding protein